MGILQFNCEVLQALPRSGTTVGSHQVVERAAHRVGTSPCQAA